MTDTSKRNEEQGNDITQAILGALEYRGFNDCGKFLDHSIWEHVKPLIDKRVDEAVREAVKRQEATKAKYTVDECCRMWYECSKCKGTMMTSSSKFCPDCGSKIVTTPQEAPQTDNT